MTEKIYIFKFWNLSFLFRKSLRGIINILSLAKWYSYYSKKNARVNIGPLALIYKIYIGSFDIKLVEYIGTRNRAFEL